jgi:hypothetical protein
VVSLPIVTVDGFGIVSTYLHFSSTSQNAQSQRRTRHTLSPMFTNLSILFSSTLSTFVGGVSPYVSQRAQKSIVHQLSICPTESP